MRPALSVIFFTVVSGAGFGLWFLLGSALAVDVRALTRAQALVLLATGAVAAAAGLMSSMLHLGQPQRAWRALSQWRSSWLSREGVASLASFAPAALLGAELWQGGDPAVVRTLAVALALLAAITVVCTAKIYTSLKTVQAWHNGYVLPGYLLFGALAGTCLSKALLAPGGNGTLARVVLPALMLALAAAAALLKLVYWRHIDAARHPATPESATGLGRHGHVMSAERPHTEENYLTHEFGFALARKHAARLRGICLVLLGGVAVLALVAWVAPAAGTITTIGATVAAIAAGFVERWLFFAEARHVVMLFYGAERA